MIWVYMKKGENYTIGFYTPEGAFCEVEGCQDLNSAAARVNYLNGGGQPSEIIRVLEQIRNAIMDLSQKR